MVKEFVDTGIRTATMFVADFKGFLLKHNFVSVAVGFVMGAAVNDVVKALVADWITPLVGIMRGKSGELAWVYEVRGQKFLIGHFVSQLINFALIALVVFLIMRIFLRTPPPPPSKPCPLCLESIPAAARRCKFCTADQPGEAKA